MAFGSGGRIVKAVEHENSGLGMNHTNHSRKIQEATNLLCSEADSLPSGYRIELAVENGDASLTVRDPDGKDIEWYRGVGASWECAIAAAKEHAKESSK